MATCFMRIEKDTASPSKFNSQEVRKGILEMNKKIYDYTSKSLFRARRSEDVVSGQMINSLFDEIDMRCDAKRVYCVSSSTYHVSTTESSHSLREDIHLDIEQITEIIRISKQLLNIEEVAETFKPVIFDDYTVEGISIYSEEARVFKARMNELRRKYGVIA